MPNDPVELVLSRLNKVKRTKSGWVALCPAHDDTERSLSIARSSDGRALLNCFAGCSVERIAAAVNLEVKDLFKPESHRQPITVADLASAKRIPEAFLRSLGVRDLERGVEIPYHLENGKVAPRRRLRTALRAKDGSYWSKGNAPIVPYGVDRLERAREAGYLVLVEGESDCWTLWLHDLPGLGIPGADMTHVLQAAHLRGIPKVLVVREPGRGGETFVAKARAMIESFGLSVEVLEFSVTPHKDPNDLHLSEELDFDAAFDRAIAAAKPVVVEAESASAWTPPAKFYRVTVPNFPVECLPDWLHTFVEQLSVAIQTPLALAGALVLAVCGLAVARRLRVEIRPGWNEPLNLFCGVAMDPGNRKSAVFAAVEAPLLRFEAMEAERLAPEIRQKLARQRVLLRALRKAENAAAAAESKGDSADLSEVARISEELAQLVVPQWPRLFGDDATPEALSRLIARHGGRFAVLSAEGGVFELMAGRYSSNNAPNFEVYLKGHAGDTIRVDRIEREGESVNFPALTVGLTFQPDVLRGLASKPGFRGRGLLARFLYVLPVSPVGGRLVGAPPVPETTARRYRDNVLRLLQDVPEPDDPASPPTIRFDDDAREAIEAFERRIEPRLGPDGDLGVLADWGAKLTGAIARLSAILHIASVRSAIEAIERPIPVEIARNAIRLGEFFLAHARAAFAEMGADPDVERAKLVLSMLRRKNLDSFTARDAFQELKGRFQKVSELRPTLQLLVEHGYVRTVSSEPRTGPGRPPSERFQVNPLWIRNSEDIEDFEEASQDRNFDSLSSKDSIDIDAADAKSLSNLPPQNPQNPQNPGTPRADAPDDEVAL